MPTLPHPIHSELEIFTDGAWQQSQTDRQNIFGLHPGESPRSYLSAGGIVLHKKSLQSLYYVTGFDHNTIIASSSYEPEAIAIIAIFYQLGSSIKGGTIYTDCKSLVDKLQSCSNNYSTVYSGDVWVSTIYQLQQLFSVRIYWVRSHPEQ